MAETIAMKQPFQFIPIEIESASSISPIVKPGITFIHDLFSLRL